MPDKYNYGQLRSQLAMLAQDGNTDISKLRVFYPKAGWTELIRNVQALTVADPTVSYDPKTHQIKVSA